MHGRIWDNQVFGFKLKVKCKILKSTIFKILLNNRLSVDRDASLSLRSID